MLVSFVFSVLFAITFIITIIPGIYEDPANNTAIHFISLLIVFSLNLTEVLVLDPPKKKSRTNTPEVSAQKNSEMLTIT
jgi:hypothetical protein